MGNHILRRALVHVVVVAALPKTALHCLRNEIGVVALMLLMLTSCAGPVSFWYQANVMPGVADGELIHCRVAAAQSVPVNTQFGQNPSYVLPVTTSCVPFGAFVQCTQSGGGVIGGDVYSYDANTQLRSAEITQCMNQKGFDFISLRQCKEKDLREGLPTYRTLPVLSENACVKKSAHGNGYMFINP